MARGTSTGSSSATPRRMILPPLYHWSPKERRSQIRKEGLLPYSRTRFAPDDSGLAVGYPYVCLSTSPSQAWGLSGDIDHEFEYDEWDLWQVNLSDDDEVFIRAEFGRTIKEVRVRNPVPPDRIWHVGVRHIPVMEPVE